MKYANERKTLLKGIDTPDLDDVATPRFLSPTQHNGAGWYIAKMREVLDLVPYPVRRVEPRQRKSRHYKRVALKPHQQPWKVEKVVRDGLITEDEAKLVSA